MPFARWSHPRPPNVPEAASSLPAPGADALPKTYDPAGTEARWQAAWEQRYPLTPVEGDSIDHLVVATTRSETMLGDTAVAVNPAYPRYGALVGRTIELPLVGRRIPIVADEHVDPAFGTGCVKVTPAHDPNVFALDPVVRAHRTPGGPLPHRPRPSRRRRAPLCAGALEQGLPRLAHRHPRLVHQPPALVGPPHPRLVCGE